jgi:glycosyltransferase involved in cell wall biosynthesis
MTAPNPHEPVAVVIPVHNEEGLIETTVSGVLAGFRNLSERVEVILVENGSHDRTMELAERLAAQHSEVRAVQEGVANYGAALRRGLSESRSELTVVFDCDLWDVRFAKDALDMLRRDANLGVVVASKVHKDSNDERSRFRRTGTKVFTAIVRRACGLKVSDTHGMKVFATGRIRSLIPECLFNDHVFDTELIVRLERAGFGSADLPCTVAELRPPRFGFMRRIPSALGDVIRLRRALRTNRPAQH